MKKDNIEQSGVLGMKWGKRKNSYSSGGGSTKASRKAIRKEIMQQLKKAKQKSKFEKSILRGAKNEVKAAKSNVKSDRLRLKIAKSKLKDVDSTGGNYKTAKMEVKAAKQKLRASKAKLKSKRIRFDAVTQAMLSSSAITQISKDNIQRVNAENNQVLRDLDRYKLNMSADNKGEYFGMKRNDLNHTDINNTSNILQAIDDSKDVIMHGSKWSEEAKERVRQARAAGRKVSEMFNSQYTKAGNYINKNIKPAVRGTINSANKKINNVVTEASKEKKRDAYRAKLKKDLASGNKQGHVVLKRDPVTGKFPSTKLDPKTGKTVIVKNTERPDGTNVKSKTVVNVNARKKEADKRLSSELRSRPSNNFISSKDLKKKNAKESAARASSENRKSKAIRADANTRKKELKDKQAKTAEKNKKVTTKNSKKLDAISGLGKTVNNIKKTTEEVGNIIKGKPTVKKLTPKEKKAKTDKAIAERNLEKLKRSKKVYKKGKGRVLRK